MTSSNEVTTQGGSLALPENNGTHGNLTELANEASNQFISFTIDEEEYAVDILSVREIKGWAETTNLPNTPEYMRGVLNLRGLIVPIFDLRCRFGKGLTEATHLHVVIIIAIQDRITGMLVDAVSDILTIANSEIRDVPKMDMQIDDQYLSGLVNVDERMVALLNVDKLFDSNVINKNYASALTADGA